MHGILTRKCLRTDNPRPAKGLQRLSGALSVFVLIGIALSANVSANVDNFRTRLHQVRDKSMTANDVAMEIKFGKEVSARILGKYKLLDDPALTRYINLIGSSLALHSSRTELIFHFAVIDDNSLNAFSAPGGYIFISKGLVEFAEDEAELAGVLAHEIAHVVQRHIVNDLNIKGVPQEELSAFARFIGASAGTTRAAFSQAIDKAMSLLFDSGFQKSEELDADQTATLLLANSGYDPSGLLRMLTRIRKQNQQTNQASVTHPSFTKRFNHLILLLRQESLHAEEFHTAKNRFLANVNRRSVKGITENAPK